MLHRYMPTEPIQKHEWTNAIVHIRSPTYTIDDKIKGKLIFYLRK